MGWSPAVTRPGSGRRLPVLSPEDGTPGAQVRHGYLWVSDLRRIGRKRTLREDRRGYWPWTPSVGYRRSSSWSKANSPALPPTDETKDVRRASSPASTSFLARSARLAELSLGIPAFSRRAVFSRSRSARSKRAACLPAYSRMADAASEIKARSGAGSFFRRPRSRASTRLAPPEMDRRSLRASKRGRLVSLMRYMINCLAPVVVILLSAFVLAGCSAVLGENPREQADEAISKANESISEHNVLFDDARATYADVKQKIESGDDPSKEKDNIAEAKNTLEKARKYLQD